METKLSTTRRDFAAEIFGSSAKPRSIRAQASSGGIDAILKCIEDSGEQHNKVVAKVCCSLLSKRLLQKRFPDILGFVPYLASQSIIEMAERTEAISENTIVSSSSPRVLRIGVLFTLNSVIGRSVKATATY
ncbi:hypothetical protein HN51_001531 [Arachis hypogaea]